MLERRRSHLRRYIASAVVLAAASVLPICMVELVYAFVARGLRLSDYPTQALFILAAILVPAGAAVLLGAAEGLLMWVARKGTDRLTDQRLKEAHWMALLYSVLVAPAAAALTAALLSGRRARQLPGHALLIPLAGALAALAVYGTVRGVVAVREHFRVQHWGLRHGAALAGGLFGLMIGAYWADRRILPGLYPPLHQFLALVTFGCSQLAVASLYIAARPLKRLYGRVVRPGFALGLAASLIAGASLGLKGLDRGEEIRYAALQHTAIERQVLMLAAKAKLFHTAAAGMTGSDRQVAEAAHKATSEAAGALPGGPRRADANLLLITVDALRADHMSLYGYGRQTTPRTDEWARRSAVVFERGYCAVPHTSFSITSLMTGTHVYSAVDADMQTVAGLLRRYGYKTGAFYPPSVFYIDAQRFRSFADRHFDFEYVKEEFFEGEESGEKRVDQLLAFLNGSKEQKFFGWIHFFEPHHPYEQHPQFHFGPRDIDAYDSEIAYVDKYIGYLLDYVNKHVPNTIIGITGDHGEGFGEHNDYYHGSALYEEQIRVPMLLSIPGVKARRIDASVENIALPVSMLAAADVSIPAPMTGADLGPWITGAPLDRLPPAVAEMEQKKALIQGTRKLIHDSAWSYSELYELDKDPGERINLVTKQPAVANALLAELAAFANAPQRKAHQAAAGTHRVATTIDRARNRDMGAVPDLITLVHEQRGANQREAVLALAAIHAPSAKPALVEASKERDPGVSIPATIGAAYLGDVPSLERLQALLARPDLPPDFRREALAALAMHRHDCSVAAELSRLLESSTDIYLRAELINVLGQLGGQRATAVLIAQLREIRTRLAATDALGRIADPAALPVLITQVRTDAFVSWREHAAWAIGRIGSPKGRAALEAVLSHDLEPAVRAAAAWALVQLKALPTGANQIERINDLAQLNWTCSQDRCRTRLAKRCEQAQELWLGLPDNWTGVIDAYCDSKAVGHRDLRPSAPSTEHSDVKIPALAAPLRGTKGVLELRTVAASPPKLTFAVLVHRGRFAVANQNQRREYEGGVSSP